MSIFQDEVTPKTQEQLKKEWVDMINYTADQLYKNIALVHKASLKRVWEDPTFTAQGYFTAVGSKGALILQISSLLQQISALADPDYEAFNPPNEIIVNQQTGEVIIGALKNG